MSLIDVTFSHVRFLMHGLWVILYKKSTVSVYCKHYREIKNFPLTIVGPQEFEPQKSAFMNLFWIFWKYVPEKVICKILAPECNF